MNKTLDKNNIYIINPAYKIRNDKKRFIITNNNSKFLTEKWKDHEEYTSSFSWITHPYLAYIYNFFRGNKSLSEILTILSTLSNIEEDELLKSFIPIIENEDIVFVPILNTGAFPIPKNFIIKATDDDIVREDFINEIDINDIILNVDTTTLRNYIPNEMYLMLTDSCVTDCVYCYADKTHKVDKILPFDRVKEILAEAYSLGMRDVEVNGGDFFCYPYWKEIIPELHKYDYEPYISTKHPITEEIIEVLKKNNIKSIQLSIDSVDNDEMKRILNVGDNYLERIKKGVELLNAAKISIIVKPVITKYNDSEESLRNLIEFFAQFEMVESVNITPGVYSIYKPFTFSSTKNKLDKLEIIANELSHNYNLSINFLGANYERSIESKEKDFKNRNSCSGNTSGFIVLPDGKVTICEQMYWHPFFILGDLSKQSIMEMWNSEKALSLWNFTQQEVQPESPCKTCETFEECRRGKGNCWRIAISAYGIENYDYPAPDCPKALSVTIPYYTPEN